MHKILNTSLWDSKVIHMDHITNILAASVVGWGKEMMKGKVRQDKLDPVVRIRDMARFAGRTRIFLP